MDIYKDMTQNIKSSPPPCGKLGNTLEDCSLVALSKILKYCHVCVYVCVQREEEKHRELKRQQELLKVANQHYDRNLLLLRGLAPWKRLIQLRQDNIKVNDWMCGFSRKQETAQRFRLFHYTTCCF